MATVAAKEPLRSHSPLIRAPSMRAFLRGSLLALCSAAFLGAQESDWNRDLELRHIGPVGNRVIAVTGVTGDPLTFFAGAASGGIFKTDDGGVSWRPVFDDQGVSSVGALAVAPSDPNVVWAGTGETFIRANISIGDGAYRSTDGGESWEHMGLEETGRIGRIVIDPRDPEVVFVAALGHCYGPQPERGIYRTRNGGESWEQVLFVSEHAGASDLVMDPGNPRILFAGFWEMEINTWSRESGGPGSSLWTSRDGGDTWRRLEGKGLPEPPWGKVGLAMSAADSSRVYALIETSSNAEYAPSDPFQGVLWRSDDGGGRWQMVSADNRLVQRPLYYSRAAVAPDDSDEVYFLSVRHRTSLDGGLSSFATKNQPGWDHHDMWIDPAAPERMIVGHDGGVSLSRNRGRTWARPQLPIAQMYHVNVDDQVPYYVYGNRQDGDAMRGPSNSLTGDTLPIGAWQSVGGCEVGFAVPTPGEPDLVWSGCYDGILELYDHRTRQARNVSVWPEAVESWPAEDLRYRFQWTFPIAISPHDPETVWVGSQHVHQTTNRGQTWTEISPDLTGDDPEMQRRTGGLTLDDAGPTLAPTVFAIAGSPLEEGVIWAGTNDGKLHLTRNGGSRWQEVSANLPDLPPLGTVSNIEPSRHRAGVAYVTVDRHQLGDTATYVFKTTDHGATWTRLRGDLPQDVFAYAHCVREDPVVPGLLYLGTENALYVSFDDGGTWRRLGTGLPPAPVHWMEIQPHFNDLVVATYGRGFWILDDLTPVQQMAAEPLGAEPRLFAPRPAYRFRTRERTMSQPGDPAAGKNPPIGAFVHVFFPESVETGDGDEEEAAVSLEIVDDRGRTVRQLEDVPETAGLHRIVWDFETDATREVKLRTGPGEQPRRSLPDQGWRELGEVGRLRLLAPPGTYTVRLEVGDRIQEQRLEVRKDPGSEGSLDDIAAQMRVLKPVWQMVDEAAARINEAEWARRQIAELLERHEDHPQYAELKEELDPLARELAAFEGRFFDLRLTEAGQDTLRWKRLLYSRLRYLARAVGRSDHRPTDSQLEVFAEYERQMQEAREHYETLQSEIRALGKWLDEQGFPAISLASTGGEAPGPAEE